MQVAHQAAPQAGEARIANGTYDVQLPVVDDRRGQPAPGLAKLEGCD